MIRNHFNGIPNLNFIIQRNAKMYQLDRNLDLSGKKMRQNQKE